MLLFGFIPILPSLSSLTKKRQCHEKSMFFNEVLLLVLNHDPRYLFTFLRSSVKELFFNSALAL